MSTARAMRACPQAHWLPPRFPRYRDVSAQVRAIFARYTALIEPLSLDEAYLDVTVLPDGMHSATAVAEAIRSAIAQEIGLTASAGVAPNKFLAKIASDWNKPNGLFVIRPHHITDFLRDLPVRKVPGVGKVTQAQLAQMHIETVGQLGQLSAHVLRQQFGRYGERLFELAQGIDSSPVKPNRCIQQISSETTFDDDKPPSALLSELEVLAINVWDSAQKKGMLGHTVTLKLKTSGFKVISRQITLSRIPRTQTEWLASVKRLSGVIEQLPTQSYRLIGVGMSQLIRQEQAQKQAELF